jgi:hypothetical protein
VPSNITTLITSGAPPRTSPARRRGRGTALAAAAAGLALAVSGLTAATASATTTSSSLATSAAATTTNGQIAKWGAGYLARQLDANGGFLAPFGAPDLSNTAYAVLALHSAGVGAKASGEAIAWLKTQVSTGLNDSDGDNPGRLSYVILAAVSAGQNPRAFGGTAPVNNLVNRLLSTARTSGSDRGLFGAGAPTFDGAFRQGVALSALAGAGVAKSTVTDEIAWLTNQQCANGLWTSYRSDTSVACPKADPINFVGPDTNSSGMAADGLAAYGNQPRKSLLLNTFKQIQTSDGGFPFIAAPGQTSDPNSTALSIQGLLSYGAKPALDGFRVNDNTAYAALASFQLGCADPRANRGAFFFPGDRSPNILATVQAVPAMARLTLPLQSTPVSTAVPRQPCAVVDPPAAPQLRAALAPQLAGTAGACPGSTGVTVAVDFTAFTGGKVQVRCAPGKPATGVAALQQADFTPAGTAVYGLAFICRINNLPSTAQQACVTTPPTNAYWAYYHANKGATTWTFSTQGASTYKPLQGSIEAWAFGNSAKPSKTPVQVRKIRS